jgi:hypothetical protein
VKERVPAMLGLGHYRRPNVNGQVENEHKWLWHDIGRKRKPFHEKSPRMHSLYHARNNAQAFFFMERDLSLSFIKPRFSTNYNTNLRVRVTKVKNATKKILKFYKGKD